MIRLARPDDAAQIHAIYAPVVRDTIISFELEPPTEEQMGARIVETLKMFPWLVLERDGRVAGYAYASRHRDRAAYQWSADVACYVHSEARRQGVGAKLYTVLLDLLKRQGFQSAFAGIALPNEASIRLHESVGFTHVGNYREVGYKLGAWRDTGWWQCRVGDAVPEPAPPRPLLTLGPGILDQL